MKQLTLQEHYNLIKEGKGHKDMFLKAAKSQFPNIIPNAATFEQTSTLLKQRSIISETIWGVATGKNTQPDWFSIFNENINEAKNDSSIASSQEEPVKNNDKKISKEVEENLDNNFDYKDPKNRDNIYGQQFLNGYYTEMKDPKNSQKTIDELLELVSKNLTKDRLHYVKDGQFGVKGLGYTEDTPGLGAGKEAKGKYKSSGYGDLKENFDPKPFDKEFSTSMEFEDMLDDLQTRFDVDDQTIDDFLEIYDVEQENGIDSSVYVPAFEEFMSMNENKNSKIQGRYWEEDNYYTYDHLLPKGVGDDFTKGQALIMKRAAENDKKILGKGVIKYDDMNLPYLEIINENKNSMIKLTDLLEGEYYMPEKKEKKKPTVEKKKVKKSAISDRVKEIEEESTFNAMEGKIQAMAEEIEMRENKLSMIDENEDLQEFINPIRIKEMQKEIDELKKTKEKMEKEYEKKSKGRKPKEVIDEAEETEEEEVNVGGKALAKTFSDLGSYENFEKAWKELLRKGIDKRKEAEKK